MQKRKYKIISFILAAALLLTGVYLDTAVEDAFFLCDFMGETFLCPMSIYTDINNSKICGRETLGECSDMEQQSVELCAFFSLLHANRISMSQGKFYGDPETIQFLCRTLDVLVTDYMHQSDGKKRT